MPKLLVIIPCTEWLLVKNSLWEPFPDPEVDRTIEQHERCGRTLWIMAWEIWD